MYMDHGDQRQCPAFLLVEALLGIAVLGVFVSAVALTILGGQEGTIMGGDRTRATYLSVRGLEAARNVRNGNFSSLSAGTYGVSIAGGNLALSGTQSSATGGYITRVTVSSLASDMWRVVAETKWKRGYARSGSVVLTTDLVNWRGNKPVGNWATLALDGSFNASNALFNDIVVSGNFAFVTSESSGGGAGLYVLDITNTTSPIRVAATFSLGAAGYELAIKGKRLYVLTGDANAELKVFDISSPASLSAANLVTSDNIPGSGRATALSINGNTLYVAANLSGIGGENELYSYSIAQSDVLTLLHSLGDSGSFGDVAFSGTAAWLGSSRDDAELRVVNVANPSLLSFVPGGSPAGGYGIAGAEDGLSIATTGTYARLGRARGTSIQEFVMFRAGMSNIPPMPPGPWYHESSGSILGIDADPSGCYGFLATSQGWKALQIIKIRDTALPEMSFYTSTTGKGRGVFYDMVRDRLYFATDNALLIFRPASPPSSCS
jgi:hypothetical protein